MLPERNTARAAAPSEPSRKRPAVNWRSVLLGLAGTFLICAVAPYNDHVLGNTFLVGNFLPVGLMIVMTVLVLAVNAPLYALRPSCALGAQELAVVLAMTLASCALPTSGLMRYLPAQLAGIPFHAGADAEVRSLLTDVAPPQWLFPSTNASDPVITQYWNRATLDDTGWRAWLGAVPWAKWLKPAVAWGTFAAMIYSAVLCLAIIVQRQWIEVERLSFPLAAVYLSLIEPPHSRQWVNDLLSSRRFWLAAAVPFLLHGSHALMVYSHGAWPEIPTKFDLRPILSDSPWTYAGWGVRSSNLFFSVIGITFFVQTKVAFSLWSMFLLAEAAKMSGASFGHELTIPMQRDQAFGAVIALALAILWTGRHHWRFVVGQMFKPRASEQKGTLYWLSGWILALSICGIVAWLVVAGATLIGAGLICLTMLLLFLVIARVVAETGLLYVNLGIPLVRPWVYLLQDMAPSLAMRTTLRTYFLTNLVHAIFTNDLRESLSVYAVHALRVRAAVSAARAGGALRFVGAMLLALAVGYVVSGAGMLLVEYQYAATRNTETVAPINAGAMGMTRSAVDATLAFVPPRNGPVETHDHVLHLSAGGIITGILSALHLRFSHFPLHPIGFLTAYSQSMQSIWLSVLAGWIAKVITIRLGGARALQWSRGIFIGLIVGESLAAGFWLVFNLVWSAMGHLPEPIQLLPG